MGFTLIWWLLQCGTQINAINITWELQRNADLRESHFPGGSDSKESPLMWENRVWSLSWEDHLQKEMAIHYSILSRKISWTEEPGGLQPMGSQRVNTHPLTPNLMKRKFWGAASVALQAFQVFLILDKFEHLCCNWGEGNGTPLQYSCLENPMDEGAW